MFIMKKVLFSIIILIIVIVIVGIRFLSGEDNWICVDGQWVKHGNPSFEKPDDLCN